MVDETCSILARFKPHVEGLVFGKECQTYFVVMEIGRQASTFDLTATILTVMCTGCQGEGKQEMFPGPEDWGVL